MMATNLTGGVQGVGWVPGASGLPGQYFDLVAIHRWAFPQSENRRCEIPGRGLLLRQRTRYRCGSVWDETQAWSFQEYAHERSSVSKGQEARRGASSSESNAALICSNRRSIWPRSSG